MTWRVARSLDTLLDELNRAAPGRSTISDGSIGDTSHAAGTSDHNPNAAGVVRARDFTHDPAGGCDAGRVAEAVRLLGLRNGHPALVAGAYVIWNRRIASDTYGWVWRAYTGSNPHDHHCHVSVATSASGYDSTARWGIFEKEEDTMTPEQEKKLDAVDAKLDTVLKRLDADAVIRTKLTKILDRLDGEKKGGK